MFPLQILIVLLFFALYNSFLFQSIILAVAFTWKEKQMKLEWKCTVFSTLWATDSVTQMIQKTRFILVSDSFKLDLVKGIKSTITTAHTERYRKLLWAKLLCLGNMIKLNEPFESKINSSSHIQIWYWNFLLIYNLIWQRLDALCQSWHNSPIRANRH